MRRLRGCLTVLFIFGCGLLVGGFLGAAFGWMACFNKIVKGGPIAVQEIVTDRVKGDLKLKGEQKAEVRKVVEEMAVELDAATRDVRPKVGEILGRGEERIGALLTEDWQRARLKKTLDAARLKWVPATPAPAEAPKESPPLPP
jgi:hypothetical protein